MRKKSSKSVIWAYKSIDKSILYSVILFLTHTAVSISMICIALVLRQIIDTAKNYDNTGFAYACVILVLIIVLRIFFSALSRYADEKFNSKVENELRKKIFSLLMNKDYSVISDIHNAEWMNRVITDTNTVANGITGLFPNFGAVCIKIVAAVVSLLIINADFIYIIVASVILLALVTALSRTRLKEYHNDIRKNDGRSRIFIQERLDNLIMVKAFGAEGSSLEGLTSVLSDFRKSRMKRNRLSIFCYVIFSLVSFGLYAYGAISCGKGIFDNRMTAGDFTAAIALISQFISPIGTVSSFFPKYYAMSASAGRLAEIEAMPNDSIELILNEIEAAEKFEEFKSLNFYDVCFSYNPSVNVFKALSFKINKGDFVALCGSSGCGKSTCLKLLMSILSPKSGDIFFELNSGIEKITSKYRTVFSYVPQDNLIISGTIREILCLGKKECLYDDEKLINALKVSCAYDFVFSCKNGLDTVIGENGKNFSYGELQRLAIARALISDRKVLLLDEVTSALDEETEINVLNNIKRLEDKTVVLVSHRKTAIQICNSVIEIG